MVLMAGEVTVPIVGHMSKSGVIVSVAAGATVLGYLWWKHKKSTAAATAAPNPTTANSYGYGASAPPTNSYGYGSAGNGYGYQGIQGGNFGEGANSAYGYYAEGNPNTPQTNAAWTQACVASLSNDGYNSETVLAACGVYLTAGELSAAQVEVIQACIANEGYPPTEGAQGFPPQMHTGGTSGGSTPPAKTTKVAVPRVIGSSQADAFKDITDVGLKPKGTKVVHGKVLYVQSESPAAGTMVEKGTTVTLKSATSPPNKQP